MCLFLTWVSLGRNGEKMRKEYEDVGWWIRRKMVLVYGRMMVLVMMAMVDG